MSILEFHEIANSLNPFIDTCFGLTRLFVENGKTWIEYVNDYGCSSFKKVGMMELTEYINN